MACKHAIGLLVSFTCLFQPCFASVGENIFFLHTDLLGLAFSLTFLVLLTIAFELAFHACKHSIREKAKIEVFQKVQAELTVLGFISIFTILVAQFGSQNSYMAENLQEFEISHLWLFFIGMMFGSLINLGQFRIVYRPTSFRHCARDRS